MSQADHTIENQLGINFRLDVQASILALLSINSGATEPPTKVAGMRWWDTANNLIKVRNGANNAWIAVDDFTGITLTRRLSAGGTGATTASGARTALNVSSVFSPLDYGASVTATTIQAAIDAAVAAGGGIIDIPATGGTITSEITHNSSVPVRIRGAGRRLSALTASGNFSSILRLGPSSIGVQIEDIWFNSGDTETRGVKIDNGSVDTSFSYCKFTGSAADLSLVYSESSGFSEWHHCHFNAGSSTTLGLELNGDNQVWRLYGSLFSGDGLGLKIRGTASDVEGGRVVATHFVNKGAYGVDVGPSFDTVFLGCSIDQQSTSCVIINTDADRVSFGYCYFGTSNENITAKLVDIKADSGNHMSFNNCTFYGGAAAIQARATASPGEYLNGLQVIGNKFLGQVSTCLLLDSARQVVVIGNVDTGTPTNGSWITQGTGPVSGQYTFDGNSWHTVAPAIFATGAEYHWGNDTGIVMRARGTFSVTGAVSGSTAHGLSRTPTGALLTPNANVGNWWLSVLSTINLGMTTQSGNNFVVTWEAWV